MNTQGSSNHISPAPAGDKPTVSSGRAITTALKEARGAKVVGIGLRVSRAFTPVRECFAGLSPSTGLGCTCRGKGPRSCLTSIAASITSVTASGASPLSRDPPVQLRRRFREREQWRVA